MSSHQKRKRLHAILLFILAFTPLGACSQGIPNVPEFVQAPPARKVIIETHTSNEGACGSPLFDANGAATGQQSPHPNLVDYCRELVIVDPAILEDLERLSFRDVLRTITRQSTGVRSEDELDKAFGQWAANWGDETRSAFGSAYLQRSEVATLLNDAWQGDQIILIAVVNRLDLKEPEGRLVFQVHSPCCTPPVLTPRPMGIIVEFALPPPAATTTDTDPKATKLHWAERWHQLGDAGLNAGSYRAELQALVEDFVTRGALKQIRTNEQYGPLSSSWEMREYDAALQPLPLKRTPSEDVRLSADGQKWLEGFLGRSDISTALRRGDQAFMDAPDWTAHAGMLARFPTDDNGGAVWPSFNQLEHESLLMSFNTCNGCHRNVLNRHKGAMHLQRVRTGEPARLSPLLSFELNLPYQLPPCIQDPGTLLGCTGDSPEHPAWNEVEFRAQYLLNLTIENKHLREESTFPDLQLPEPLYYRYH